MYYLMTFLMTFIDPVFLPASAIVGWFSKTKKAALINSAAVGSILVVGLIVLGQGLGDSFKPALFLKVPACMLIAALVHGFAAKKRLAKRG